MSRFSSLLNSINQRLDAPGPIKARILLEISADLEDAYDYYRESGETDAEATRLAQEKFVLDDAVIAELSALHQPLLQKWVDKVSINVGNGWERMVLILTLLIIALLSGRVMLSSEFANSSIFITPVWGLTILGIVLFFIKYVKLYLLKDGYNRTLRKGINVIAYLGIFCIIMGFAGYFYELLHYRMDTIIPGGSLITVLVTVTDSASRIRDITTCFVTTASVMMASLFSGMLLALLWYMLNTKATHVEITEAESLLAQ